MAVMSTFPQHGAVPPVKASLRRISWLGTRPPDFRPCGYAPASGIYSLASFFRRGLLYLYCCQEERNMAITHPVRLPAEAIVNEKQRSAAGRLMSLDVFRGLLVAGMILVDNPGS